MYTVVLLAATTDSTIVIFCNILLIHSVKIAVSLTNVDAVCTIFEGTTVADDGDKNHFNSCKEAVLLGMT